MCFLCVLRCCECPGASWKSAFLCSPVGYRNLGSLQFDRMEKDAWRRPQHACLKQCVHTCTVSFLFCRWKVVYCRPTPLQSNNLWEKIYTWVWMGRLPWYLSICCCKIHPPLHRFSWFICTTGILSHFASLKTPNSMQLVCGMIPQLRIESVVNDELFANKNQINCVYLNTIKCNIIHPTNISLIHLFSEAPEVC